MKKLIFPLLILAVCTMFVSCVKESTSGPSTAAIGGNWTVVNEVEVVGNLNGTGAPTTSNYTGTTSDYFKFGSNSKLYWNLNTQKDTGTTYKISGDTVLSRNYFYEGTSTTLDSGFFANYIISNLTSHTCTLKENTEGPDVPISITINLSR